MGRERAGASLADLAGDPIPDHPALLPPLRPRATDLARRVNVFDVYGLGALISLADFKFHIVTFLERTWGFALVNEYVLASIGRSDESEALS